MSYVFNVKWRVVVHYITNEYLNGTDVIFADVVFQKSPELEDARKENDSDTQREEVNALHGCLGIIR